jgi:hypothetical protein
LPEDFSVFHLFSSMQMHVRRHVTDVAEFTNRSGRGP